MKHYLQVTDADFERASRGGAEVAQQADAGSRTDLQQSPKPLTNRGVLRLPAMVGGITPNHLAERTGFEPAAKTQGERVIDERRGAKCGADDAESGAVGADLESLIAAWPTLPEAVKADILAMAKAANS